MLYFIYCDSFAVKYELLIQLVTKVCIFSFGMPHSEYLRWKVFQLSNNIEMAGNDGLLTGSANYWQLHEKKIAASNFMFLLGSEYLVWR